MIENGAATILTEGLAYDRCQVGIVTDLDGADALADFDIDESRSRWSRCCAPRSTWCCPKARPCSTPHDPRVAEMAELCDGEVIFYGVDADAAGDRRAPCSTAGGGARARTTASCWPTASSEAVLLDLGRLTIWRRPRRAACRQPAGRRGRGLGAGHAARPDRRRRRGLRRRPAGALASLQRSQALRTRHPTTARLSAPTHRKQDRDSMEVIRIRALRGPNLWSRHTAIEAIVACPSAERAIDRAARLRGAPARALPRPSASCIRSAGASR